MTHVRPRLDDAACRGREDLYLKETPDPAQVKTMRAICAACWDRPECFAYALEHEDRHVWAGMTASERRKLRQQYGIKLDPILIGSHVGSTFHRTGEDDGDSDQTAALDGP